MTNEDHQLDGVEAALLELHQAEELGVMRRSPVDPAALMSSTSPLSYRRMTWLLLPVAASVLLAVGVGARMFRTEVNEIRGRAELMLAQRDEDRDPCDGSFLHCFTGPRSDIAPKCSSYDYDKDGDIDLADFSAFQLACIKPSITS